MKPQFYWRSSFMNVVTYDCTDSTGCYQISLRLGISAYERSIYNGTPEQYDADCGAIVGWLTAPARPIPPETVLAFNEWQAEKFRDAMERMEAQPERYGVIAPDDPIGTPIKAKGAAYWADGWRFEPAGWLIAA